MSNLSFKSIITTSCLLLAGMIYAQEPVRIECKTGEGIGKNIHLWRVEKGEEKSMVNAGYNGNGYYGFSFIPEYEGFYVIGDDKLYHYPLYLKPGDQVSLYMDKDTVYLTGKHNSRENKVLYEWVNLSKDVCEKAMYFQRRRSTFEDFFPDFEKLLAQTEAFKAGIKTQNPKFNALMKRSVDFELDLYALNFLYTPRSKHPSKEQRIAYYNTLIRPDKFTDTVILEMPYGMGLLNKYAMHNGLENNIDYNNLKAFLSVIPNKTLQGEMVVKRGRDFGRSYYEYLQFLEQAKPLVTTEQWALLEEKASKLYEAKKGEQAIDFTYPDAEGKMHSLSDYKGKVVVVDVWAT
ncbi:MAG TPA: redoxin domain-containing protein [Candidatus Odoribacter faecigallinarum]|uniref:Redoxin domain-containing protein n=1 Tax=Candidatus Odoribacter faecigallinarum TaxID=2838706 RepID=A0A9D1UYJ2_9BACT|nr:redoxin domain-containing protein [Candidatus Odoribacter faecigallinarum]